MTRPLGETQQDVLRSLYKHARNEWYLGCGWLWDTPSNTTKIMNSLERRGLVKIAPRWAGSDLTKFILTLKGRIEHERYTDEQSANR